MTAVGIAATATSFPGTEIPLQLLRPDLPPSTSPALRPPQTRHHCARQDRCAAMIGQASLTMFEQLGIDVTAPGAVDILLTNCLLPDLPITGCGAEVAELLGITPEWILDLHNSGCASFVYMLKLARDLMALGKARTALLCTVSTAAGRIYDQAVARTTSRGPVAGDGCGVAYVFVDGPSSLLDVEVIHGPRYAAEVGLILDDDRKWWEPGTSQPDINLARRDPRAVLDYLRNVVPAAVRQLCDRLGVATSDIDVLVTNQPNRVLMRTWRKSLGLDPARHLDTFDLYGNIYPAGIPVTLDHAARKGLLRDGELVVMAGVAHAGDLAAAAAVRWQGTGCPSLAAGSDV